MNILVTGGTGFIGQHLCCELSGRGHELMVLSRSPARARKVLPAGTVVLTDLDQVSAGTRVGAIVNLAGEGIAERLWTETRKKKLVESRVGVTRELGKLVRRLETPPEVLVNGSGVGFYGDAGDADLDEDSSALRRDFGYLLCDAWEQAAREAAGETMRLCVVRTGVVLGPGGMLGRLLPLYRLGFGARLGDGEQWVSWIHIDDMVRVLVTCVENRSTGGLYNAVAPAPVTHARFHQALARLCRRPGFLRIPAWPLRTLLGEMSILFLGGQRVRPRRLQEQGFRFRFADLDSALTQILDRQ